MNDRSIKSIVIVGGGTSGWMSAAYLNKALNKNGKSVDITLIEASDIPTIGVGEATIPMVANIFNFLEIPEEEWMSKCNATFKLAIKFAGWYDNSPNDHYWHTFGSLPHNNIGSMSRIQEWLAKHKGDPKMPFAKAVHEAVHVCEAKKNPKAAFEQVQGNLPYAFHLDAGLVAELLKKQAIENGVIHLLGTIEEGVLDDKGMIDYVASEVHGKLYADLFIDCSGFKSLLIEKSLGEKWDSYSENLLVDSAIAIGTDYPKGDKYNDANGGLKPYTTATAIDAGWVWHTPLVGRDGNGYVYSSQFASKDQAEEEFRSFLGPKSEGAMAKHLAVKSGKMNRSWVKNCVSIGLACGFIEPMESTGIALIQIGLQNLIYNFPDKDFDAVLLRKYNEAMTSQYENIRDFIVLHYVLTKREDTPFWKAVKNETVIPDSLQVMLDEWKYLWPNSHLGGSMFGAYNYSSILAGMHYYPEKSLPIFDVSGINDLEKGDYFEIIQKKGQSLVDSLPTSKEYFEQLTRIKEFQTSTDW